jgi:ABC-type multidrug transport system fused ATPase/permease subunit
MEQAFHTVAQYDSGTAVVIGKATQVDSAAMKTISVLGLAFLPGTFISVGALSAFIGMYSLTLNPSRQYSAQASSIFLQGILSVGQCPTSSGSIGRWHCR